MSPLPPRDETGDDALRHFAPTDGGILGGTVDEARPLRPLGPGQVRCPLCEQPRTPNPTGRVSAHGTCPGFHAGDAVHLDELPDVQIDRNTDAIISAVEGQPALEAGSLCQDCRRWLPGERRLCGRCSRAEGRRP